MDLFRALSVLSGVSLATFGAMSLAISLWSLAIAGMLVSAAILVHGLVELRARKRALKKADDHSWRILVRNQLALAISVSLYALWQIYALDVENAREILEQPVVVEILALYPPNLIAMIDAWLPRIVAAFYWTVIAIVCLACGATAAYYRAVGRSEREGQTLSVEA